MKARKDCPVCGVENTGGKVHSWHKQAAKRSGYTMQDLHQMISTSKTTVELIQIVSDAVDRARYPDGWRSKPKKRTEYHREYYWRYADKRRAQRKTSKLLRRRVRPIIAELCKAVDIGRLTANW